MGKAQPRLEGYANAAGAASDPISFKHSAECPGDAAALGRAVLWLLRLLGTWAHPAAQAALPSAETGRACAQARHLFSDLVERRLQLHASFVGEASVGQQLCSGQLYALGCALMFHLPVEDLSHNRASDTHAAVLALLADNGYAVVGTKGESGVAESAQSLSLGPSCGDEQARDIHLQLLWMLMEVYTHSVLDLETLQTHVAVLHQATPDDVPCALDDSHGGDPGEALLAWLAAVCAKFDRALAAVQLKHGKAPSAIDRAMPPVTDLLENFGDGVCIPGLWSFYEPQRVPFSRLKIKGDLAGAPRRANWQLVRELCPPLRTGARRTYHRARGMRPRIMVWEHCDIHPGTWGWISSISL